MKILIVYASAGAGHRKAAESLHSAFRARGLPGLDVKMIDALDLSNPLFKKTYPSGYIFLVTFVPFVWKICFYFLGFPPLKHIIGSLRHVFNRINGRGLARCILQEKPDVVICAHFFSAEVIGALKKTGKFSGTLITCVTDFGAHQFWVNPGTDYYVCACEATKKELTVKGAGEDRIFVFGIPISRKFSVVRGREETRAKLGLMPERFTVLAAGGGFGAGPVQNIVACLERIEFPLQIVIICGSNARLRRLLSEKQFANHVHVYGYVGNMEEFMAAADVMITKSGGLTVSEALASGLPMIIVSPIPGQETRNACIAEQAGAAIRLQKISRLCAYLHDLFADNRKKLQKMRENTARLAKPDSSEEICRWVLENFLPKK